MKSALPQVRRYVIEHPIGRGGFGTVYRARFHGDGGFSKPVALKLLHLDTDAPAEVGARLRDEARILGLLRHRAIVGVDRLALLDGRWALVMEYVEGADLGVALRRVGIPMAAALEIAAEVAGALVAAWCAKGLDGAPLKLLHRDIKPSNIRLTSLGEVKLLDFGIARASFVGRESHTRSLHFGTPGYMAPERLEGVEHPSGDVFSLGVVLAEMLGRAPLGRTRVSPDTHDPQVERLLLRVGARNGEHSEPVVELLREMLAFDARQRPSTRDVERRLRGLTAAARPPSLREWAEVAVPALLAEQDPPGPDPLSGVSLQEATLETPRIAIVEEQLTIGVTAPRVPARVRLLGLILWGAIAGFVISIGLAAFSLTLSDRGQPEAPPSPPAVGAPVDAEPPAVVAGEVPSPQDTASGDSAIPLAPTQTPTPTPTERTARRRAPKVDVQGAGSDRPALVTVGGDAGRVWLLGPGRSYRLPATVPAGEYKINAEWRNRGVMAAGVVRVGAGNHYRLNCLMSNETCLAEEGTGGER